jgi:hypothetical protein
MVGSVYRLKNKEWEKSPAVNKLRARHLPETVVTRKREGIMGKNVF